jgi:cytochrome c biogenesis protein CcmG/thiol:disulfide interchange protein DsbE
MRTFGVALLQHTKTEMGSAKLRPVRRLAFLVVCVLLAGCGSDGGSKPASGPDPLVQGGRPAFEAFVEKQRGTPVVVNKWASWCGPCRAEFPVLQEAATKLGKQVAFVGLDANDNDATARKFLAQYPVPYPSYVDRNAHVAQKLGIGQNFPTTLYYDAKGDVAYIHQGPYTTTAAFESDIRRYAMRAS